MNAPSFRHGFLGPWDGLADLEMAADAMVRGGVQLFCRVDISRAITCDIVLSVGIYDLRYLFVATIPIILVL